MSSDFDKESEQSLITEGLISSKATELNFSVDSGMDEEPTHSQIGASDDSDEEEIVCKRKVKRKAILDEDESDEDGDPKERSSSNFSSENKENESFENNKDEDDDDDLKLNFENLETESDAEAPKENSDKIDSEIDEDEQAQPSTLQMELKNNDLFDAESDEEDRPVPSEDENEDNSPQEGGNGDENDEGFDESQMDPQLLAKLKKLKGASKTQKQKEKLSRKAKPTAEQMSELYSDSQRMLRDSRVNLPYYEPETKSLEDFLARASKKKQEYSVLNKPKDIQKAWIIHEKLSVAPPKQSPSQSKTHLSLKDKSSKNNTQDNSQPVPSDTVLTTSNDSGVESQEQALSQASTVILGDCASVAGNVDVPVGVENDDAEELPDIDSTFREGPSDSDSHGKTVDQNHFDNNQKQTEVHSNSYEMNQNSVGNSHEETEQPSEQSNSDDPEVMRTEEKGNPEEITLQRDPSCDLFNSLTTEEQLIEAEKYDLCIEIDNNGKDDLQSSNQEIQNDDSFSFIPLPTCVTPTQGNAEVKDREEKKDSPLKSKSSKLRLLEKLQQQGLVVVPDLPKLSGSPESVINLDSEATSRTPRDQGVLKLMDRLVQHSARKKPNPSYDVNLSIIEKENVEGEQKELKLKSVTYHVEEEKEELPSTAPGTKLVLLKEKLGVGMKMKREESRMRRQQMYNLENEEGFTEKVESDNEEMEEAEMTDDESSSDEEEPDEEDDLMDMMNNGSDDGEDYNPLLDNEAKDDDEDDYGIDENSDDVRLRFEVSDDEEGDDEDDDDDDENGKSDDNEDDADEVESKDESTPIKGKKKASLRILSEDEDDDFSNIQRHQKPSILEKDDLTDNESLPDVELTPLTKHFQDTQYHRENSRSPELYGPSAFEESSNSTRHGDNLNDSGYYNPHSQMLDADGYLKMTQTQKMPKSRIAFLVDAPEDNAIMDGFDSSNKMSAGKIFEGMSGQVDSQADNMTELLGLCSGRFQENSLSEDAINPSQNRREEDNESELSNPFHIVEDEDDSNKASKRKRIKPVLSDSDDERERNTDVEEDSNHGTEKFTGFKDKFKKGIRKDFVDDEAELSGSEYDSDENVDLAEEDDILEEEAGDKDMAGVSAEELRNQVGKVHMKQLQDDDDRAVLRFKEMYLQDGDLYTDGNGRMRHFRWKDMGESSQQDMFEHQSDEEHVEEDTEEVKWRKERIEREKFLEESQQGDDEPNKELQKFGQLFVKRRDSTTSLPKNSANPQKQNVPSEAKPALKKKGSFLSRGKDAFVKFAQIAKTALGGNSNQTSRSFVFQSKETQQEEDNEVETMPQPMQPPKRKAHSVSNSSQPAKKPKLTKNSSMPAPPRVKRGGSIFNLLDP